MRYLLLIIILFNSCKGTKQEVNNSDSTIIDDRIYRLDENGANVIDICGNPIYTYPDGRISLDSLKIVEIEPDCDSLNGSIAVNYPSITKHNFIRWIDSSGNKLPQYNGIYKIENIGIGGYKFEFGNRNHTIKDYAELNGKLDKEAYHINLGKCDNSDYTNAVIEFQDTTEVYIVSWDLQMKRDTAKTKLELTNLRLGQQYDLLITNSLGCKRWEKIRIEGSNCSESFVINLEEIVHTSDSLNNGTLEVSIDTASTSSCLLSNYSAKWSREDYGLVYKQLWKGEHCITVYNYSIEACKGCKTVKCFKIN